MFHHVFAKNLEKCDKINNYFANLNNQIKVRLEHCCKVQKDLEMLQNTIPDKNHSILLKRKLF